MNVDLPYIYTAVWHDGSGNAKTERAILLGSE